MDLVELLVWAVKGWFVLVFALLVCIAFFAFLRGVERITGRVASWWFDRERTSKRS